MTAPAVNLAADPELRKTGLGGTDMARLLGMSRFGGPMDVYMEKRGMSAPLIETEPMKWGKILEEPVAQEYARKSGRKVRRAAAFLRHPVYPQLFANLDRWSLKAGTPKRVLECKTSSVFTADDFGEEFTDQVPDDYLVQVMHYMVVTDTETADLAVLIGGNKHRVYTIQRDGELVDAMLAEGLKFWDDTQRGIPPAMDGSPAAAEYLRKTYRDKGTERHMTPDLANMAMTYEHLRLSIKELEEQRAAIGNGIRELMGDDHWAEGEGVKVVYGERLGSTRTDWPAVIAAATIPEGLIEKFTTRGEPVRTLTVTIKPA